MSRGTISTSSEARQGNEFEDRNEGAETGHRGLTVGRPAKISSLSQPCGDWSKDREIMALAPSKNAVEMLVSEVVPTASGLRRPIEQRLDPIVSGVRIAIYCSWAQK
jgi:hypothetical protein